MEKTIKKNKSGLIATNETGYRIGETHHNSKYPDNTVEQVRLMREQDGKGYRAISKETGIPVRTVRDFCNYERRAQMLARWKKANS